MPCTTEMSALSVAGKMVLGEGRRQSKQDKPEITPHARDMMRLQDIGVGFMHCSVSPTPIQTARTDHNPRGKQAPVHHHVYEQRRSLALPAAVQSKV